MRLLSFALLLATCLASPLIIINSGKAKCFSVEAPLDTIIRVNYEAPDILTDKKDPSYGPAYITVNVRPAARVMDTKLHTAPVKERLKPTSELLEKNKGSVSHKFEADGEASICVRASTASFTNPMRFSLRVLEVDSDPKYQTPAEEADLDNHLGHIELEMKRIEAGMRHILSEADFGKEREVVFHKQEQDMLNATIFWPVVQVVVLLATGFAQGSHIVRFFQSRRII